VPEATRPSFPAVYGIHEEADGLLGWDWAVERLERARNYWVATTRPDGRPHAMPVWGLWHQDAFYFSSAPNSRKLRNLAANPAVVVHLESGDEVVVVEGEAERTTDEDLLARLSADYTRKYGYEVTFTVEGRGLVAVSPRIAYAWREQDFPQSATRFSFPAR
jgi:PPOX class probable F420-dependent enzyme